MSEIKRQLKEIVIRGLRIPDRSPSELPDDQPLLGGDIEIDSIDVLQLVLDIERQFGIKLVGGKFDRDAWRTIDTLAAAVEAKLKEPAAT
jgi:acyl carrier protein